MNVWEISWVGEETLAYDEGICYKNVVNKLKIKLVS
jgi:hypothetical protein